MDLAEYVNVLQGAEQQYDVNQYSAEGFKVWPLFRAQTISMFRNPEGYFRGSAPAHLPRTAVSIRQRLLNAYHAKRALAGFRKALNNANLAPCEVLLYSKHATHTDKVNGRWFDRFVDPFYERLHSRYRVLKLELLADKSDLKASRAVAPVYIAHEKFRDHFYFTHKDGNWKWLSETGAFASISQFTGIPFEQLKVDSAHREVVYYRDLFREVFKKISPRVVFLKCYYENDSAGLLLAAKEKGIKVVDIQHGKQGIAHPMYTHFTRIPAKGYELLPDFFWNWGSESVVNIEKWMDRKQYHVPVLGGNLWLAKWKSEEVHQPDAGEQEFVSSLGNCRKVVLFTMQPQDKADILPPHVLEAIRSSPPDWTWLIRAHPFQKISEAEIRAMIGPVNVRLEMKYATLLPLFFLLRRVHHHVTLWSSTCFEANDFVVPTTIAHEFGKKLYGKHIAENIFSFSVSGKEIVEIIRDGKPNKPSGYIETSAAVAEKAFQRIGLPLE